MHPHNLVKFAVAFCISCWTLEMSLSCTLYAGWFKDVGAFSWSGSSCVTFVVYHLKLQAISVVTGQKWGSRSCWLLCLFAKIWFGLKPMHSKPVPCNACDLTLLWCSTYLPWACCVVTRLHVDLTSDVVCDSPKHLNARRIHVLKLTQVVVVGKETRPHHAHSSCCKGHCQCS